MNHDKGENVFEAQQRMGFTVTKYGMRVKFCFGLHK